MTFQELVQHTIRELDQDEFIALKEDLSGEYLMFFMVDEKHITQDVLAEKVCDYFEKVLLTTLTRDFNRIIDNFLKDIASIVENKIADAPKHKKESMPTVVPRARKYYEKAVLTRNIPNISVRNLIDYTRIMMCLYMAIINNNYHTIDNFEFSSSCLDIKTIINSMKSEKALAGKRNKFNTKDPLSKDTCTFIITIIMLHTIIDERVEEE